jgi:hypothetical protein
MMMFELHGLVKTEGAVAIGCSDFVRPCHFDFAKDGNKSSKTKIQSNAMAAQTKLDRLPMRDCGKVLELPLTNRVMEVTKQPSEIICMIGLPPSQP